MGDRTFCRLKLHGIIGKEDVDRLAQVMASAEGGLASQYVETITETPDDIEFEEVNYAHMDANLDQLLREMKLSYVWEWDTGDEYSAGVQFYDARTDQASPEYTRVGEDLMLSISQAERPEDILRAKEWQAFWNQSRTLVIPTSNHELMQLAADGKLPEGWLDLYLERKEKAPA